MEWGFENQSVAPADFQFNFSRSPSLYYVDVGRLSPGSEPTTLTYTAPDFVSESAKVPVQVSSGDLKTDLWIFLAPETQKGVLLNSDDLGPFAHPIANVVGIADLTPNLLSVSFGNVIERSLVREISVSNRSSSAGFAGMTTLVENFAIRMMGTLQVPSSGSYTFRLSSDDGANFIIDGRNIINLDGVHGYVSKVGGPLSLKAGPSQFLIEYFQGRGNMGLSLEWKLPGSNDFNVIPSSQLSN